MLIERIDRLAVFAVGLALVACGEPEVAIAPIEAAPSVESVAPIVPPAPVVAPLPEPAPPRPPPPDPEALARERQAAAQLRFEREHPLHGVAYHFLAQVHRRADASSPVIGYMRRGAQFRAKPGLRGPGCARGWHEVPGGGFVCRGEGFALGDTPQTFDPSPVGAATGDALPYVYAWVARDDVPQYWRVPSVAEERAAIEWIRAERAREERAASAAPVVASAEATAAEEPEPDLEAPPGLDGDAAEENAEAPVAPASAVLDGGPAEQPSALRMRMMRGFYVSLDGLVTAGDRRFYRTVRGGFVPADALIEGSPPAFRGVVLGGRWTLPLGFVFRGGVRTLTRDSARGVLELGDPVERTTPLPLSSELIERGGRRYRVSDRGVIVREDALRIARPIARPAGIPQGARWVHVDLAQQIVVAYEGDRPVFATMVSTGREGFDTPTGTFRIQSKHVSTTMDDPNGGAEAYSIEDVPWTMYFEGSYALHGAFWHDRFGHRRSHGCVNLAPADARWIFQWSEPALPPGWHGMSSGRAEGTFVHVTSEAR